MNQALTALLLRDLQLENPTENLFSEEDLLQWLAHQVAYLIAYRLDFLMSLMYRLDISEAKVRAAISPMQAQSTHIALAQLIMERQKERLLTKQYYQQPNIDGMEDCLKW
ncbi:MAG: hypothetical protein HC912_00655 [Saprospiraceae bacterium]|nr:hypothetical protein [Saprospiraceae bacterium]